MNTFSYGISDLWSVGIGIDYALKNKSKGSMINDNGFKDFRVNTSARFIDSNYKLDLIADLALSETRKIGGQEYSGNAKSGASSLFLGVKYTNGINKHQYQIKTGVTALTDKKVRDYSNTIKYEDKFDISFSGIYQFNKTDTLSMGLSLDS